MSADVGHAPQAPIANAGRAAAPPGYWAPVLGLYFLSFCLPVGPVFGAAAFVLTLVFSFVRASGHNFNTRAAFEPLLFACWLANPALWLGVWLLRRRSWAAAAAAGAIALALGSLILVEQWQQSRPPRPVVDTRLTVAHPDGTLRKVGRDPNAQPAPKPALAENGVGYYAWLASMAALVVAGSVGGVREWASARRRGPDGPG